MIGENKEECCGCGACAETCPQKCIRMIPDNEGFLYPKIEKTACISCNKCESVCQFKNLEITRRKTETAYAAKIKDEETRSKSSSGGMFAALARRVLVNGGIVYGCKFSDDYLNVAHVRIDDVCDVEGILGSKYIQSSIITVLPQVRDDLEQGRMVLFSGTPCQIAGLKKTLNKKYNNLLCADVVCHGVPSSLLWQAYVVSLEQKFGKRLVNASFRSKNFGMFNTGDCFKRQFKEFTIDEFMQLYLNDTCLRLSCYNCKAKEVGSHADLTLADLWGAETLCNFKDMSKGVSLVIPHTEKGFLFLDSISDVVETEIIDFYKAIAHNKSYDSSSKKPQCREDFYRDLTDMGFNKVFKKYIRLSWRQKIKQKIKASSLYEKYYSKKKGNHFDYGVELLFKDQSEP